MELPTMSALGDDGRRESWKPLDTASLSPELREWSDPNNGFDPAKYGPEQHEKSMRFMLDLYEKAHPGGGARTSHQAAFHFHQAADNWWRNTGGLDKVSRTAFLDIS